MKKISLFRFNDIIKKPIFVVCFLSFLILTGLLLAISSNFLFAQAEICSVNLALSSATAPAQNISPGQIGVSLVKLNLIPSCGSIVKDFAISLMPTSGYQNISTLRLYKDGAQVGSALSVTGGYLNFIGLNLEILANQTAVFEAKADINSAAVSGSTVYGGFAGFSATNFSGAVITNPTNMVAGNVMTVAGSGSDASSPTIPTMLVATKDESNEVDLSWTASTDNVGVMGYEVWRSTGTWSYLGSSPTTTYIDTTVVPLTGYYYYVIAYDAAGNKSPQSSHLFLNTPVSSMPVAPATVTATLYTNKIYVSWPASAGKYNIWRNVNGGSYVNTGSNTIDVYYKDFDVISGNSYSYRIYGCKSDGTLCTSTGTESNTIIYSISTTTLTPTLTPTILSKPDLTVSIDSIGKSSVIYAETPWTWVTYHVNNIGSVASTGPIYLRILNYSTAKTGYMTVDPIAAGSSSVSKTFAVGHDSSWPVGTYSIKLEVDYNGAITEANEANNFSNEIYFTVTNLSSTIVPTPTATIASMTTTPALTMTPVPTIASGPLFNVSAWIEGVPTSATMVTKIGGVKKVYAYGYNSNPDMILTGLEFRLYDKGKMVFSTSAPAAVSADGNKNWSGIFDTAKFADGGYVFSARGWHKTTDGIVYYFESNAINIDINNSLAATPVPSTTPSGMPSLTPSALNLEFAENYQAQIFSGDKKVAIVLNQTVDNVSFFVQGPKNAEFAGIKIDALNYYFIWNTKDFSDNYYTLTAKAVKGTDFTMKSMSVKINNTNAFISPTATFASPIPSLSPVALSPVPMNNFVINAECTAKAITTPEGCQQYMMMPIECRQQNILDPVKCQEFFYTSAMPAECVKLGITTQTQCTEIIMVKSLPEECRLANIITADSCQKFMSEQMGLSPECKTAGIITGEECRIFMEKNFMPQECKDLGITNKDECDYALRNKVENLGGMPPIEFQASNIKETSGFFQECKDKGITDQDSCEKFILAKNFPEECRNANVVDKGECEKIMFKKYAPKECVDAGLYSQSECEKIIFKKNAPPECIEAGFIDPEGCKKFMFEKYSNREGSSEKKFPIECEKAGAKTFEACEKVMKQKYLPEECKSNGITESEQCELYMKKKYMPKECQEAGVFTLTECNKVMFKKYAPEECKKAGIEDEKSCNDFMFNKYAPKTLCQGIDDWKCKNAIKEDHLGVIAATQTQFGKIKEEASTMFGKSVKAEDFKEKMPVAFNVIPVKNEQAGLRIVSTTENVLLNEKNDLVQTAPLAVMIDSDGDGLPDDMEKRWGTDSNNPDTDGDGFNDGEEVKNNYDPKGPGKIGEKPAPIDEAIMQNKVLSQPKTEGEESDDLIIAKVDNNANAQGGEKNGYVFSGKAEPNTVITLYVYSDLPVVMTVKTDEYGNWKYELSSSLVDGDHEVYVAVNDNNGKVVTKSNPLSFFVKEAKAVSAKEFATAAVGENQSNTAIAMINYWIIVAFLIIVAVLISIIFIIQRKKRIA